MEVLLPADRDESSIRGTELGGVTAWLLTSLLAAELECYGTLWRPVDGSGFPVPNVVARKVDIMCLTSEELRIHVADVVFSFLFDEGVWELEVDSILHHFMTNEEPDVHIQVHWGATPPSHPCGAVLRTGHTSIFFDADFRYGDVHITLPRDSQDILLYTLQSFLDLATMTNLIGSGRALAIHACGINDNGRGFLFAGPADSGKTTLANLWKGCQGVTVLSDERLFLRKRENQYWMYCSLLKGRANPLSPRGTLVERIFLIRHGDENVASPKRGKDGVVSLLRHSSPDWYHHMNMQYPLDFCIGLSQRIPCYDLGFVPSREVVDFVRGLA